MSVEFIARQFHDTYERLAPKHGWKTQKRARVPWEEVPQENRDLMMAVVQSLLDRGVIRMMDQR